MFFQPSGAAYIHSMPAPLVLVTGFGPFPGRKVNPSGEVARLLEARPPPGVRVRACELPVSFRGAPAAGRAALESLRPARPRALLGLGVQREPYFRLERRARGRYDSARKDNDGQSAAELALAVGEDRENGIDLAALARVLRAAGAADVRLSEDAGGYVCELTYHALLGEARALGVPVVFLHVPPARVLPAAEQAPLVGALVAALVTRARSAAGPRRPSARRPRTRGTRARNRGGPGP